MPYYIEPMRPDDIPLVSQVEKECFPTPWPTSAYRRELRNTAGNYYIVARTHSTSSHAPPTEVSHSDQRGPFGLFGLFNRPVTVPPSHPVVGFAGMWTMLEEAHITTIGVAAAYRGKGVGELLLSDLIAEAMRRGANWVTLEVRVSNVRAQNLYRKYGFTQYGVRKRYYSDNGEDAFIMWSPPLKSAEFQEQFSRLRQALTDRLVSEPAGLPRHSSPETGTA